MDRILHRSTLLPLTPAAAFSLFTTNEGLTRWLAPAAEVEPWVGGKYELFWNLEDRATDSNLGCRVTAIAPAELLAFEWKGPAQYAHVMNAADPLTHVVVSFSAVEGGTRVHLVHSGWRSDPVWEEARGWFDRAWAMAFEALEALPHVA